MSIFFKQMFYNKNFLCNLIVKNKWFNNKIIYLTIQFSCQHLIVILCVWREWLRYWKASLKLKIKSIGIVFIFLLFTCTISNIYIIYTIKVLYVRYLDCKCCTVYCFQLDLGIFSTYSKVTSICGNQIHFFVWCF